MAKESLSLTQKKIETFCANMSEFLQEKNARYGDSATNRTKIFNKNINDLDGILVRLDDKIARITNHSGPPRRNDMFDLMGYIILYCTKKSEEDTAWLDPRVDLNEST